jgi:hypothetical protein
MTGTLGPHPGHPSPKCGSHLGVTITERDGFSLGLKHSRDKLEASTF